MLKLKSALSRKNTPISICCQQINRFPQFILNCYYQRQEPVLCVHKMQSSHFLVLDHWCHSHSLTSCGVNLFFFSLLVLRFPVLPSIGSRECYSKRQIDESICEKRVPRGGSPLLLIHTLLPPSCLTKFAYLFKFNTTYNTFNYL